VPLPRRRALAGPPKCPANDGQVASDFRSLTADIEHIKYTEVVKDTSTKSARFLCAATRKCASSSPNPTLASFSAPRFPVRVYAQNQSRRGIQSWQERALVDQYVLLGFGTKSQNMEKSYDIALSGEEEIDQHKAFVLTLTPNPKTFASKSQRFRFGSTLPHGCPFSRNSRGRLRRLLSLQILQHDEKPEN